MNQISPSMMCAPIDQLKEYLAILENKGIDYLHIDVMDGHFVPNLMFGTDYIRQLRSLTSIPLDIHLMITNPEDKIDWFNIAPGEIVSLHIESTTKDNLLLLIKKIRSLGALPFIAINPLTPLSELVPFVKDIQGLLMMTVTPGFAGQKATPQAIDKIALAKDFLLATGREDGIIEVDGNVSFTLAPIMKEKGADLFVLGSSSVFSKDFALEEGIDRFRACLEN